MVKISINVGKKGINGYEGGRSWGGPESQVEFLSWFSSASRKCSRVILCDPQSKKERINLGESKAVYQGKDQNGE